ncbi:DUF5615 family PIN-like protein [Pseudoduganella namucuonensis]|uniref:DUF5615 family PIN-like protein n=1 Tax=Pseudoduganella namucuonensis TaxID=1035707 RepID=UPI000B86FE65|nr:DUF5615 family PIN-like protein [Pseudoduganella namucuonensis]
MRLLLDMNISPRWVSTFMAAGHLAVHWTNVGPGNASDTDILDYARRHDYIVITQDLDFGALLAESRATRPSVVQLRFHAARSAQVAARVADELDRASSALLAGALLVIEPPRARLTPLPLL